MTTLEKIKSKPAGQRIITLKCRYSSKIHEGFTLKIQPAVKKGTNFYLGIKNISEKERENYPEWIPWKDSVIEVKDNMKLDLDNPRDLAIWEVLEQCPNDIGHSLEHAQITNASFYVYLPEEQFEKQHEEINTLAKALELVYNDVPSNYVNILRLLGIRMENAPEAQISLRIKQEAKNNPRKIIEAYQDPLIETKLFLYAALDKGIIKLNSSGYYFYKDEQLAKTEDEMIYWLRTPDNKLRVDVLYNEVYPNRLRLDESKREELEKVDIEDKKLNIKKIK